MNYSELLLIIWTRLHSDVEGVFCVSPNPGEPCARGGGGGLDGDRNWSYGKPGSIIVSACCCKT